MTPGTSVSDMSDAFVLSVYCQSILSEATVPPKEHDRQKFTENQSGIGRQDEVPACLELIKDATALPCLTTSSWLHHTLYERNIRCLQR